MWQIASINISIEVRYSCIITEFRISGYYLKLLNSIYDGMFPEYYTV
jgi:hypothetical protein